MSTANKITTDKHTDVNAAIKPIDIIDMIILIKQRINDLTDNERKEIYQIIYNSNIDEDKIQEKGDGILIKFKDISRPTISEVYKFMIRKLGEKQVQLDNCTVENVE